MLLEVGKAQGSFSDHGSGVVAVDGSEHLRRNRLGARRLNPCKAEGFFGARS